jgi:hypothetical protein
MSRKLSATTSNRCGEPLFESQDPQSAKSVIEASFLLGRKWVSVTPFSPALRLTDFDVSAALHAGTLLPGAAVQCRHCGAPDQLGHDEICLTRAPWTVARHEQAKHAIGQALAKVEGVQVHLEPLITGTRCRNDIRITGSASSGLSKRGHRHHHRLPGLPGFPDRHAACHLQPQRTTLRPKEPPNSFRNTSTLWQGKNKADTHLRTDHSDPSSSPLVGCWKRKLVTLSSSGNRS